MDSRKPTILIIVGITGDLSTRKLLPALGEIIARDAFSGKLRIVGVTRKADVDIDFVLRNVEHKDMLKNSLTFYQMDLENIDAYQGLADVLLKIGKDFGQDYERLFCLSVPPQVSLPIIKSLGISGLADVPGTKLLLEKPFGSDLNSAQDIIKEIDLYFKPEQVYRIDHYLAKSMTQNIITFRQQNIDIENKWNNEFIESITITASEEIGIEGRTVFYEQTGALRDMILNHLIALAATTIMDIDTLENIPEKRHRALASLTASTVGVVRGQYANYKNEVGNDSSQIETFVSMTLLSSDPRWIGVPINLVSGKMLDKKLVEIKIKYKKDQDGKQSELIVVIQPDEKIIIDNDIYVLDEMYSKPKEAYEQVIESAPDSNRKLFTSPHEVMESWRIAAPVLEAWDRGEGELYIYEKGTNPIHIGEK